MTGSFFAKAKTSALLPFAIGASLLQAGCSLVTKNGELSEKSPLYILGMLAGSLLYCLGDAIRNHAAAARVAEHKAAVEKLTRLDAKKNTPIVLSGQYAQPQKKAENLSWIEPAKHQADAYKSWHDVPGVKNRPIGRDGPERTAPVFKTWEEAMGGRKCTGSFGKDSPQPNVYKTMEDAAKGRNGAPARIAFR